MRGIYIFANDKVTEQSIALLESIRFFDPDIPVALIPYDDNYAGVLQCLKKSYGVKLYEDLDSLNRIAQKSYDIFGSQFFARPNNLRKPACWFGEFDEFLYIDTDIIVFEKVSDNFKYLQDYDFICNDYQHTGGIASIFSPVVLEQNLFTQTEVKDVFNSGWWASKKGIFTEQELYETFAECAARPEYFDFSQKTSDQPILNYLVLKRIPRRFNLVRRDEQVPGSWAGSRHFQRRGDILVDTRNGDRALQYLHWAGIRIEPGCPYWDIWKHYRYLGDPNPPADPPPAPTGLKTKLKQMISGFKKQIGA